MVQKFTNTGDSDAARLVQKIPEVSKKIESGALHLSQISKMQKVCRQIKKETGHAVTAEKQRAVIAKIENQNTSITELILSKEFNIKAEIGEKYHLQQDESTRCRN